MMKQKTVTNSNLLPTFLRATFSLFTVLGVAFALSGCLSSTRTPVRTPAPAPGEQAPRPVQPGVVDPSLPPAPFELGEVVAENEAYYREFWGMTEHGFFIVQDFYRDSTSKFTDPYIMMRLDEVKTWMLIPQQTLPQQYGALEQVGIEGPYVQWHPNGNKAIEGKYQNGRPQGTWSLWYESGTPMLKEELVDGVREGPAVGWHANGKQAGQGQYASGIRYGVWTVWFENGNKMQEGAYENEQQQGDWVFWYDNGNSRQAGRYLDGKQVGPWKWWDRQSKLVRELDYGEQGELTPGRGSGRIEPRGW